MLRQQTDETAPLPAAQVRVTPEELAAAISRIEARKDASQRHAEGTVAIGEVVQQLGLDATPEEVLAEVRAGRRAQVGPQNKRLSPKQRLGLILMVGALLIGLAVMPLLPDNSGSPSPNVSTVPTAFIAPVASSPPRHILLDPDLLVGDASGKLVMLSEVGDNQPVHCCYFGGRFLQYTNGSATWTLIKHGGKVYVRGRMPRMSPKVLARDGADVVSPDTYNGSHVPVTLALKGFTVSDDGTQANGYAQFHAQNIHLDSHTYEKWQP